MLDLCIENVKPGSKRESTNRWRADVISSTNPQEIMHMLHLFQQLSGWKRKEEDGLVSNKTILQSKMTSQAIFILVLWFDGPFSCHLDEQGFCRTPLLAKWTAFDNRSIP